MDTVMSDIEFEIHSRYLYLEKQILIEALEYWLERGPYEKAPNDFSGRLSLPSN